MRLTWKQAAIVLLIFTVGIVFIFSGFKEPKAVGQDTRTLVNTSVVDTSGEIPRVNVPNMTITSSSTTTTTTTTAPPTTTTTRPRSTTTTTAPPTTPRMRKIHSIYHERIPHMWRHRVPARFKIRSGSTSIAYTNMEIHISTYHADSSREYLAVIIAHEFGHLIAYKYGSQEYLGAPPRGWPPRTSRPEEHWADCVQAAFFGYNNPTRGLPPCEGRQLSWARDYLSR